MADNVNVTGGSGHVIHADEYVHGSLGAGKTQLVKLVNGTIDSDVPILVDIGAKANALRVAPANDITDATYIGDIKFGEAEPNSAAIKTAVELIDNAVDGNYLNVNVNLAGTDVTAGAGAVAAGTPRITLASDDPAVALLTTIDSDTSDIKTAIELLDNSVDGNYLNTNMNLAGTDAQAGEGVISASTLRVTIATDDDGVTHLATIAGDATSIDGKITACNTGAVVLAASDGTDIGNVDVASVVPGTGATNLGKAEDAEHTTGDVGVMSLAVRFDAGGALAGTDGDYTPLQVDSNGALRVTGGGGGTEYNEDEATPATIVGSAVVMERDDALGGLTPAEGDWAGLRCDANGALWTHDDALDACVSGTEMQVDIVASIPAGDNNIGNVDIASSVAIAVTDNDSTLSVDDGDSSLTVDQAYHDNFQCNANMQIGDSDVGAGNPVPISDNGGAITVDGTVTETNSGSIKTAIEIMDDWDATHASAAPSDGVQVMGAGYSTALPADIGADADAARLVTDRYGRLCIGLQPQAARAVLNNSDTTTAREIIAATVDRKAYVTSLIISVDTAGNYWLEDGDATAVTGKMYFAANGGCAITFPEGTPLSTPTTNKALNVKGSAAGNVGVTVTYYLAP